MNHLLILLYINIGIESQYRTKTINNRKNVRKNKEANNI